MRFMAYGSDLVCLVQAAILNFARICHCISITICMFKAWAVAHLAYESCLYLANVLQVQVIAHTRTGSKADGSIFRI